LDVGIKFTDQERAPGNWPGVEVTPSEVWIEMTRIQQSKEFRSTRRCYEFLSYVVERALNGQAETLKERVIGMELFGRPVSYEPSEDATVRVKAGQVRKRLHDFYATEGAQNPVRIELPSGSYVPLFRYREQATAAPEPMLVAEAMAVMEQTDTVQPHAVLRRRWMVPIGASIALLVLAVCIAFFRLNHAAPDLADKFWAPMVNSGNPVWLCASTVPVYTQRQDPPASLDDMVSTRDQFLALGDLNAVTRISEMMAEHKHSYRLRVGSELSYHDLQTSPAIFVGYSYSRWNEISHQLRYSLINNAVLENGHLSQWSITSYPADPGLTQDYALISRFFDPDTHSVLVEIAGISHFGTEAAGNLVANSQQFSDVLRALPQGWQNKNIQILLRVNMIHGSPGVPVPVANYVW